MPLGAHGSRAKFYWIEEVTEGTSPGGNWAQFPAFSLDIDAVPGLQADSILSANTTRNAADAYQSVARVEGTAVVPADTVHVGWWMNWLLGDPTTTGTNPNYTHVFKSGGTSLPTRSIEKAFPDIGRYEIAAGVRVNTMSLDFAPDGAAQLTFGLLCLTGTHAGSSGAGTPVVTPSTRFHRTQGSISYNGTALPGATAGSLRFSNGMAAVPTVGSGVGIGGIDAYGEATGGGSVTLRFANHTQEAAARALTAVAITYKLTINANTSLEFHYPRCFLEPTSAAVSGPGGITRSYNFIASHDSTDNSLLRVTLKNQVASYA
jgi:hypothetical protein